MSELAQYFTGEPLSTLLTNSIYFDNPRIILDLGIGNGSLTSAAQKRWKDAAFFGVDVDNDKVTRLNKSLNNVSLYNLNSLDLELPEKINVKVGSVDVAVCNPPYLNIKRNKRFAELLNAADLTRSVLLKSYTTDLLFFAQNIALLKTGGVIGIILPAGLICGHEFKEFRLDLLTNHSVESVIELESKIFKKTEAKTFILIVKKGINTSASTFLSHANAKGEILDKIEVNKSELHERMDYAYHANKGMFSSEGSTIKSLAKTIQRGNYTHLELKALNVPYFHTTSFKDHTEKTKLQSFEYDNLNRQPTIAVKGDILLGRVGKSCHNQILFLQEGRIAITDCVYRIETSKEIQKSLFSYLNSKNGRANLKLIKHGVCAQVISKKDLENIVIAI